MCFQSLVVKRKDVLGVWKTLLYQLLPKLCPSIGFTRLGLACETKSEEKRMFSQARPEDDIKKRRRYQCFRYLSFDLQHPAAKRVLLL